MRPPARIGDESTVPPRTTRCRPRRRTFAAVIPVAAGPLLERAASYPNRLQSVLGEAPCAVPAAARQARRSQARDRLRRNPVEPPARRDGVETAAGVLAERGQAGDLERLPAPARDPPLHHAQAPDRAGAVVAVEV